MQNRRPIASPGGVDIDRWVRGQPEHPRPCMGGILLLPAPQGGGVRGELDGRHAWKYRRQRCRDGFGLCPYSRSGMKGVAFGRRMWSHRGWNGVQVHSLLPPFRVDGNLAVGREENAILAPVRSRRLLLRWFGEARGEHHSLGRCGHIGLPERILCIDTTL